MAQQEIVFVTGNANKLKEIQKILAPVTNYKLINSALDLEEIQESSLEQIATKKVKEAVSLLPSGTPVFVEDTALGFDALNGLPGAYIKWFLKKMSLDELIKILDGFESKTGKATTTIAYSDANGKIHIFQGITHGNIVSKRGSEEFGWDAIFEPLVSEGNLGIETYSEMSKDLKNEISHRGKAFRAFKDFLLSN
ncbi:hypothetical protein QEN19_001366 [Hanseniaspora menglaensis]